MMCCATYLLVEVDIEALETRHQHYPRIAFVVTHQRPDRCAAVLVCRQRAVMI